MFVTHAELDDFINSNWGDKLTRTSGTEAEFNAFGNPYTEMIYYITDTMELKFFFPDLSIPGEGEWVASGGDALALTRLRSEVDVLSAIVFAEHVDEVVTDDDGDIILYVDGEMLDWDNSTFDADQMADAINGVYEPNKGFVKDQDVKHDNNTYYANVTKTAVENTEWVDTDWRLVSGFNVMNEVGDGNTINTNGKYFIKNNDANSSDIYITHNVTYFRISDPFGQHGSITSRTRIRFLEEDGITIRHEYDLEETFFTYEVFISGDSCSIVKNEHDAAGFGPDTDVFSL